MSLSSQQKNLDKQLLETQNLLKIEQTKLANAQRETLAAKQQLRSVQGEIDKATEKAVAQSKVEIDSQTQTLKDELGSVSEQLSDLKESVVVVEAQLNALKDQKIQLQAEILGANTRLETVGKEVAALQEESSVLKSSIQLDKQELSTYGDTITANRSQIVNMEQDIALKEEDLARINQELEVSSKALVDLQQRYEVNKTGLQKELDKLTIQIAIIEKKVKESLGIEEATRKQLAEKEEELQSREDVVKKREINVNTLENKVKDHAKFMQL